MSDVSSFLRRHADPIWLVRLAPLERGLGLREEILGTEYLQVREGDHARGQARHPLGSEIREGMAGDYLPQPLDELPTALGIGLGEDQRELVAAVASREVGRGDLALQQGADLGEHAVAGLLPEPLVDLARSEERRVGK